MCPNVFLLILFKMHFNIFDLIIILIVVHLLRMICLNSYQKCYGIYQISAVIYWILGEVSYKSTTAVLKVNVYVVFDFRKYYLHWILNLWKTCVLTFLYFLTFQLNTHYGFSIRSSKICSRGSQNQYARDLSNN